MTSLKIISLKLTTKVCRNIYGDQLVKMRDILNDSLKYKYLTDALAAEIPDIVFLQGMDGNAKATIRTAMNSSHNISDSGTMMILIKKSLGTPTCPSPPVTGVSWSLVNTSIQRCTINIGGVVTNLINIDASDNPSDRNSTLSYLNNFITNFALNEGIIVAGEFNTSNRRVTFLNPLFTRHDQYRFNSLRYFGMGYDGILQRLKEDRHQLRFSNQIYVSSNVKVNSGPDLITSFSGNRFGRPCYGFNKGTRLFNPRLGVLKYEPGEWICANALMRVTVRVNNENRTNTVRNLSSRFDGPNDIGCDDDDLINASNLSLSRIVDPRTTVPLRVYNPLARNIFTTAIRGGPAYPAFMRGSYSVMTPQGPIVYPGLGKRDFAYDEFMRWAKNSSNSPFSPYNPNSYANRQKRSLRNRIVRPGISPVGVVANGPLPGPVLAGPRIPVSPVLPVSPVGIMSPLIGGDKDKKDGLESEQYIESYSDVPIVRN